MMEQQRPRASGWSRESRLLLLTVAVCAVVLIVLARLRFPEAPTVVDTVTAPLERLAARASYDALAADIQRVEPMIAPNLVVLRVAPRVQPMPYNIRDVLTRVEEPSGVRHIAALRTSTDTAIAAIDSTARIDGIVGVTGSGSLAVLALDPVRGLARVRVPDAAAQPVAQLPLAALQTPVYVVVVEGTQAGVTLRPVFLGRGDRFTSSRWTRPLLPLGGVGISQGALLFSLAGEFLGVAVIESGAPAVAGARDLFDLAARLAATPQPGASDLGIDVQALTPDIAAATGASAGVVVAEVNPDGASASILEPGDVITAVGDRAAAAPDEFLLGVASRTPGEAVQITFVRSGVSMTATLSPGVAAFDASAATPIAFVGERGAGTRIERGSEAPVPGLQPGDVVTRAGAVTAPTPLQLRRVLAEPTPSGLAILVVRRDGRQQVTAVPAGGRSDAAAR